MHIEDSEISSPLEPHLATVEREVTRANTSRLDEEPNSQRTVCGKVLVSLPILSDLSNLQLHPPTITEHPDNTKESGKENELRQESDRTNIIRKSKQGKKLPTSRNKKKCVRRGQGSSLATSREEATAAEQGPTSGAAPRLRPQSRPKIRCRFGPGSRLKSKRRGLESPSNGGSTSPTALDLAFPPNDGHSPR